MYKEDIAMNNEDVLFKDPSYRSKRIVEIYAGLTLIAPVADAKATGRYAIDVVSRIEQLYNVDSDTPILDEIEEISTVKLSSDIAAKLNDISKLPEGWDGYGASAVSGKVVGNTIHFLNSMQQAGVDIKSPDDIYPTPYGTIVVEYNNERGLVSMEIGATQVGFFTDYPGCGNFGSRGIDTDFESIPEELKNHLLA